jgi:histidine triad (HIT) family protein
MPYDPSNIFAKMIRKEIPVEPVFQNDVIFAIRDIAPAAAVHVLAMPKGEYSSFNDFTQNAAPEIIAQFFAAIQKIATEVLGLEETGYRLIMNHGRNASQTVPHFHVHILGGEPLGGLLGKDRLVR